MNQCDKGDELPGPETGYLGRRLRALTLRFCTSKLHVALAPDVYHTCLLSVFPPLPLFRERDAVLACLSNSRVGGCCQRYPIAESLSQMFGECEFHAEDWVKGYGEGHQNSRSFGGSFVFRSFLVSHPFHSLFVPFILLRNLLSSIVDRRHYEHRLRMHTMYPGFSIPESTLAGHSGKLNNDTDRGRRR